MTNSAPEPTPAKRNMWRIALIAAGVFGLLIITFVGFSIYAWNSTGNKLYYTPSESMSPTIQVNERIRAEGIKKNQTIVRGWIVVFNNPEEQNDPSVKTLIKRVVAVPGDVVDAKDGILLVNGVPAKEPYIAKDVKTEGVSPLTVPPGQYYLLGDNRPHSLDSRHFGTVTREHIQRHVVEIVYPFNRRGAV